jgi:hypothetical protein
LAADLAELVVFYAVDNALRTVDYYLRAALPVGDNIIGIRVVLVAEELAIAPMVALPFEIQIYHSSIDLATSNKAYKYI